MGIHINKAVTGTRTYPESLVPRLTESIIGTDVLGAAMTKASPASLLIFLWLGTTRHGELIMGTVGIAKCHHGTVGRTKCHHGHTVKLLFVSCLHLPLVPTKAIVGTEGMAKRHRRYSGYGKTPSWGQWVWQNAIVGTVGRAKCHDGYSG